MMNNIDEYLNQISLMKQALLFYANEDNYLFFKNKDAPIALDEGAQARFALETLEKVEKVNKEMEADYLDVIKEELPNQQPQNIINLLNEIKKIK